MREKFVRDWLFNGAPAGLDRRAPLLGDAARREAIPPANETLRIIAAQLGSEAGLVVAGLVGFEALDGLR